MAYIGSGPTRFNTADDLTVTGDAEFNGNLTVKGTTTTIDSVTVQNFDMGDSDRIRLGDSQDLQIYHNGSASVISDVGTGNFFISGDNDVFISKADLSEVKAKFSSDGAVSLYYNGSPKLATTATGVDVTGAISSNKGSAGTLATFTDGVNSNFVVETSSLLTTIGNGGGSAALAFKANNTEAMRIDSSGNVGIGTSVTGDAELVVYGADAATIYKNTNTGTGTGDGFFVGLAKGNGTDAYVYQRENANMIFGTNNAERFRINASGHITQTGYTAYGTSAIGYIGDASNLFSGSASDFAVRGTSNVTFGIGASEKMRITSSGEMLVASTSELNMWRGLGQDGTHLGWNYCASQYGSNTNLYMSKPSGYTDASYIAFFAVGIGVGSISTNGSATSYNTSSDYRLKENVTADWDATTRLKQLNPVRFNFISDADTTVDGFLAHEVQDIVPEAISGTKDAVDEEGNPKYQGIDQSKLVPLLVKTIQELEARIAALETA